MIEDSQVPLQNLDAERAVLGAMILKPAAADAVLAHLTADDFAFPAHRDIFSAIQSLSDRRQEIELLTVKNELQERGKLAEVGGEDYIIQIAEFVPSAANALHYAKIVQDKATIRRIDAAGFEIQQIARDEALSTEAKLESAERLVYAIGNRVTVSEWVDTGRMAMDLMADVDAVLEGADENLGIACGFYDLDAMTTGFYGGDLVVIGARPSMGKTALALKMAINIAQKTERRIAFFSLEMGHKQLGRRVMSMLSGVPSDAIKRKGSAQEHYRMISDGCELMYALPISVNEQSGISIPRMRADLRRLKRDRQLGIVMVDYLQLMSGTGRRGDNRTQEVGEIAKGLKEIAKEFDVPVIALAQLNRGVENREGNRPRLSDLRESGDIEAAADLVLLLYRENYYRNPDEQDTNPDRIEKAELIIAKHRNGATGIVTLGFQPKLASFENVRL